MPRKLLIFAGCVVLSFAAQRMQKILPYAYTQQDLPNGLRLVAVPTDSPNIVSVFIVVQAGSRNEVEPGHTGFAHLFEHLMFKGTPKYSQDKYNQTLRDIGAASNAFTTEDFTCYYTIFSKEDLETVLGMEADRFQNLKFSEGEFKTETLAVLGEYNKNASSPFQKLEEVAMDTAFDKSTYKHTTMGFLKDIQDMPNQYEYGLKFFDRYYRPEYTTVTVVGDVEPKAVRALAEKYWGGWKRGSHKADIKPEPPQGGARTIDTTFHTPTLPIVDVAYHAPAYDDEVNDTAVLDVISFHSFSPNSPIYKKLVVEEQKVEDLSAGLYDHVDPYLFEATATVKDIKDLEYVKGQILGVFEKLKTEAIPARQLDDVKSHLRYQFALSMDSTSSIANTLAHYIGLRRTPETINKRYALYRQVTPADVQRVASKYFVEGERTIATLTSGPESKKAGAK